MTRGLSQILRVTRARSTLDLLEDVAESNNTWHLVLFSAFVFLICPVWIEYPVTTPCFGLPLFDQKNRENDFYQALTRPSRITRIYELLVYAGLWDDSKSGKLDQEKWRRKFEA